MKESDEFQLSFDQEVIVEGNCFSDTRYDDLDKLHDRVRISLVSKSDNKTIISESLPVGASFKMVKYLPPGKYSISLLASGNQVYANMRVRYKPGSVIRKYGNQPIAGLRVARVETHDASGSVQVRKYFYSKLDNLENSSSPEILLKPDYERIHKVYVPCISGNRNLPFRYPATNEVKIFEYCNMSSSTFNNIYVYTGSPVSYSAVVESFGENFEGGGIEHHFLSRSNFPGGSFLGEYIPNAPLVDNSYLNGKERFTHYFKKRSDKFVSTKKIYIIYKEDARVDNMYKSYVVNKKYNLLGPTSNPPQLKDFANWDFQEYWHYQKWVYPMTVRTLSFDENGIKFTEDVEEIYYENVDHALSTKHTYKRGGNVYKVVQNFYPQDIKLTGSAEDARVRLVDKHMLSSLISQVTTKEDKDIRIERHFSLTPEGFPLISSTWYKIGNFAPEKRIEYTHYNHFGKLLEQGFKDNVKEVYLWGYNSRLPVAQILGSDYEEVKVNINQKTLDNPENEVSLMAEIEKLRAKIPNALVSGYAYNFTGALTQHSQPNGMRTYFEYDGLERLVVIRDHEKNILRKICYNYAGQPEDCFFNPLRWEKTGNQRCVKDAVNNNTGIQELEEKNVVSASITYGTRRWIVFGQNLYACPLPSECNTNNCNKIGEKCINGKCEVGRRICTASVLLGNFKYRNSYHFIWSDGSTSETFYEIHNYACAIE